MDISIVHALESRNAYFFHSKNIFIYFLEDETPNVNTNVKLLLIA